MTVIRLRYLQRFKDRHGKVRIYFRRPGYPRIALPNENDPDFFSAYQSALSKNEKTERQHDDKKTLGRLINKWMASPNFTNLARATRHNYQYVLKKMHDDDYAHHCVSNFEALHIRRFVERISDKPAAANRRLSLFKILFDYAVDLGWIASNPARDVKKIKYKSDGHLSWSDEHIRLFEQRWPSGTMPRLALALLLYTGQRRGDVLAMGAHHIAGNAIRVSQQKRELSFLYPFTIC